MDSTPERACQSCGAATEPRQQWCLECGSELPRPRRTGLRPAVGIATTLTVLVGAASAGGYTLLQDKQQPPPAPATVAQAPPPTTTAPPATTPPATTPPSNPYTTPSPPATTPGDTGTGGSSGSDGSGGVGSNGSDSGGSGSGSNGSGDSGSSGATDGTSDNGQQSGDGSSTGTTKPKLVLTNIALGAAAVAYAPYAAPDVDLGDPSRAVDGSTKTAWKTPQLDQPNGRPQMGVYIDLADKQKLRRLVLETSTPGMSIEVYGAVKGPPETITAPGWDHLATRKDIGATTKIALPRDGAYRYVLVWVTGVPEGATQAAISELELLSMQPE